MQIIYPEEEKKITQSTEDMNIEVQEGNSEYNPKVRIH